MSEEKQKDTERNAKVLDILENEITHQRIGVLKQLVEDLWGQTRTTSNPLAHAVALNAGISIDVGGDCVGQTIEAKDLIEALKRAEETNDSEIATFGKPLSAKRLTTYVHRQIVEAKNQQAIRNLINIKKLACKHCRIWFTLPAEGRKVSCIYKNCGQWKEVYEDSPACTRIDPVEEVIP